MSLLNDIFAPNFSMVSFIKTNRKQIAVYLVAILVVTNWAFPNGYSGHVINLLLVITFLFVLLRKLRRDNSDKVYFGVKNDTILKTSMISIGVISLGLWLTYVLLGLPLKFIHFENIVVVSLLVIIGITYTPGGTIELEPGTLKITGIQEPVPIDQILWISLDWDQIQVMTTQKNVLTSPRLELSTRYAASIVEFLAKRCPGLDVDNRLLIR